jgi:CYTH domain-containing protein
MSTEKRIFMEIEQKFLVKYLPENLHQYECHRIEQAYLCSGITIRIRKIDEQYIFTYKKPQISKNLVNINEEIELYLDQKSYDHLSLKKDGFIVKKRRYIIPLQLGLKAELDIFEDRLNGLVIVEVEFSSEKEIFSFAKPDWFGENVSKRQEYTNSYLSGVENWQEFNKNQTIVK